MILDADFMSKAIMKRLLPLVFLVLPALPAAAGIAGCYGRSYSESHLASQPGQQIRSLRLELSRDHSAGSYLLRGEAIFRDDTRPHLLYGYCSTRGGDLVCVGDCDNGVARFRPDASGRLRMVSSFYFAESGASHGCHAPHSRNIVDRRASAPVETVFLLNTRGRADCDF